MVRSAPASQLSHTKATPSSNKNLSKGDKSTSRKQRCISDVATNADAFNDNNTLLSMSAISNHNPRKSSPPITISSASSSDSQPESHPRRVRERKRERDTDEEVMELEIVLAALRQDVDELGLKLTRSEAVLRSMIALSKM